MVAYADAVLRIGSQLGPGGFSSLQSMIQMVGQVAGAVKGAVSELDKFSAMMKRVDMQMVNYADSASKSQIETTHLMRRLNEMNIGGINPTKEQFAALSKAATEMSQRTGVDATDAFHKLTESIIKGTAEGLIPYGVQLKATSDKHKDQQTALREMTRMYGDLDIKLTNNSQRLYALSNNWGTLTGVLWEFVNRGEGPVSFILDSINEKLGDMTASLSSLTNNTKDYLSSWQYIIDIFNLTLGDTLGIIDEVDKKLSRTRIEVLYGIGGMEDQGPGLGGVLGQLPTVGVEQPKTVGTGGAKKEQLKALTEAEAILEVYKTLQGEKDDILKKNVLESQRQWESAEAARQMLDLALGIEQSVEYQAIQEERIQNAEEQRVELMKERIRLLGLETPVNLQGGQSVQPMTDAEAASELSRGVYENAAAQVDLLYAQAEELLQKQEEWDKTQAEFQVRVEEQQRAYLKMKNEQFSAELQQYGVRQDAIEQIMELSQLERERALQNIEDTYRVVQVTEKLNTAWGVVKSTFVQVAEAYEKGTQGMTTAQAVFYYVDAIIGAVSEAAKAAAAAASYDYLSAALHTTAAAGYAATIALAAAHGGASGGGQSGVAAAASGFSAQSTHTAGRYSGGYSGGQGSSNEVTLLVSMNPTLAAFGAFVDLNDRAARSGDQYFKVAG